MNQDRRDWLDYNPYTSLMPMPLLAGEAPVGMSRTVSGYMYGLTDAANLETWRGMSYQNVVYPADQKTGDVYFPYEKAK